MKAIDKPIPETSKFQTRNRVSVAQNGFYGTRHDRRSGCCRSGDDALGFRGLERIGLGRDHEYSLYFPSIFACA